MKKLTLVLLIVLVIPSYESAGIRASRLFATWPGLPARATQVDLIQPRSLNLEEGQHEIGPVILPDYMNSLLVHFTRCTRTSTDFCDPAVNVNFTLKVSMDTGLNWVDMGSAGDHGGVATRPDGTEFTMMGYIGGPSETDPIFLAHNRYAKVVITVTGGTFKSTMDFQAIQE